jgi:hypothetical protein
MAVRHSFKVSVDKPKQFTSWSYTRYSDYQRCPAYAKYKHLDKMKEPESPAMARGSAIHELAEKFSIGELKKLPAELRHFSEEFAVVKQQKNKLVEQQWAFTRSWEPARWDDWQNAWLRVKVDLALVTPEGVLKIIDHKTGQIKPDRHEEYTEQTDLYVVSGMAAHAAGMLPRRIEAVEAELWYLDAGVIWPEKPNPIPVKEYSKLQKKWERKVTPMLSDTRFAPRPGNYCRWCSFSKAKGGPCQY